MTNRTTQRLVLPIFFLPAFLSTVAVFYWLFEMFRTFGYAAAYDRMSNIFESQQAGISQTAWLQFTDRYQVGLYSAIGITGCLIAVAITLFCVVRIRQLFVMVKFAKSSALYGDEADLMKPPIGFWTDVSVRAALGLLLIAISLVIGMAERKRDAFEMAQTEIVYPDIEWYSNIEFTVGLLGCFVLSSTVFLFSRINVVMFQEDKLMTDSNLVDANSELANWEAAIKR